METAKKTKIKKSKKSKIGCEEVDSSSSNIINGIDSGNGCLQEQIDRSGHDSWADTNDPEPDLQVQDDVMIPAGAGEGVDGVRGTHTPADNQYVIYEQSDPPDESWDEIKVGVTHEVEEDYLSTSSASSYCPSPPTPPSISECTETTVSMVLPLSEHAASQQLLPPAEQEDPAATILEIQCNCSDQLDGKGRHVERFESRLTLGTAVENGQVVNKRQYEESELKQREQRMPTGQELSASSQLYHSEQERVTTSEGGQRLSETSVQKQETHESTEFSYQVVDGQNTRCAKTRRRSSTSSHNAISRLEDEPSLPQQPPEALGQVPRGWHTSASPEPSDSSFSSDSEEDTDDPFDVPTTVSDDEEETAALPTQEDDSEEESDDSGDFSVQETVELDEQQAQYSTEEEGDCGDFTYEVQQIILQPEDSDEENSGVNDYSVNETFQITVEPDYCTEENVEIEDYSSSENVAIDVEPYHFSTEINVGSEDLSVNEILQIAVEPEHYSPQETADIDDNTVNEIIQGVVVTDYSAEQETVPEDNTFKESVAAQDLTKTTLSTEIPVFVDFAESSISATAATVAADKFDERSTSTAENIFRQQTFVTSGDISDINIPPKQTADIDNYSGNEIIQGVVVTDYSAEQETVPEDYTLKGSVTAQDLTDTIVSAAGVSSTEIPVIVDFAESSISATAADDKFDERSTTTAENIFKQQTFATSGDISDIDIPPKETADIDNYSVKEIIQGVVASDYSAEQETVPEDYTLKESVTAQDLTKTTLSAAGVSSTEIPVIVDFAESSISATAAADKFDKRSTTTAENIFKQQSFVTSGDISDIDIPPKKTYETSDCELAITADSPQPVAATAATEHATDILSAAPVCSVAANITAADITEIVVSAANEDTYKQQDTVGSNVLITFSPKSSTTLNIKEEKVSTNLPDNTTPAKKKYPTRMDTKDKFVVSFNSDTESDSESELSDEEVEPHLSKTGSAGIITVVNGFCSDTSSEQSNKITADKPVYGSRMIVNSSDGHEITADKRDLADVGKMKAASQQLRDEGAADNTACLLDSPCLENGDLYQISSTVIQAPATTCLLSDFNSMKESKPVTAASAAEVGTLVDINSDGIAPESGKAEPAVSGVGKAGGPPSTTDSSGQYQQQGAGGVASYSQELLAELTDTCGQPVQSTSSENKAQQQAWERQSAHETVDSSQDALNNKAKSLHTITHNSKMADEEGEFNNTEQQHAGSLIPASHEYMEEDIHTPRSLHYRTDDNMPQESKRNMDMGSQDTFKNTSTTYASDDDDPDSTESLIKRILAEARRDRESGGGRYHVSLGDDGGAGGGGEECDVTERPRRKIGSSFGDMESGEDLSRRPYTEDSKNNDSSLLDKRLAKMDQEKYGSEPSDDDLYLSKRLGKIDQGRTQPKYMTREYGAGHDDDLYSPGKYKYGQAGRGLYDDIDADSDVSSGRRRVNNWRRGQMGYDDRDEEDVLLPTSSRRPLRMQHNFDTDDVDDDNDSYTEPEEPLFTDEDFVPEKREETDEIVRERTHNIRSVVDNQSEVVDKLRRASRSFDDLQDEIKELRQSLLESQMRRDANDTDIMDYAQTRMDPAEMKRKPLYKTIPTYDPYDDEECGSYSSGYQPKSKSKDPYDPDDPMEMDPLPRKALGSLATSKYGGLTAYDKDRDETPSYGDMPSYSQTPSYANRYKSYPLGGANRFRRTHSLYDDVDSNLDGPDQNGDDNGTSSLGGSYKYGRYTPSKYGSFDLESNDRPSRKYGSFDLESSDRPSRKYGNFDLESNDRPSYSSSRYKSPIGSYTPSYRPSSYKSNSTRSFNDNNSNVSSSPSSTPGASRYNTFSRSQTLGADYGSTLSTSRPRSPSNFEPPTTSRFLQKVRDRKKANGEETSEDLSSASRPRDKPFRSRFIKKSFDSDYGSMGPSSRSSVSSVNTTPDKAETENATEA